MTNKPTEAVTSEMIDAGREIFDRDYGGSGLQMAGSTLDAIYLAMLASTPQEPDDATLNDDLAFGAHLRRKAKTTSDIGDATDFVDAAERLERKAQEPDDDALIRGLRRSAQIVREAGLVNSATFMERAANRLQAKAPETDHDGIVVVDEADFTQGEE